MTHGIVRTTLFSAVFGAFVLAAPAVGGTLVPASDVGWYNQRGDHIAIAKGFMAGYAGGWDGQSYRAYFTFNLAGITQPIVGATLQIYSDYYGYDSPHATERFSLFDVSTPTNVLKWGQTGATSIYNDIGSGANYGSALISASSVGWVGIGLNSTGVLALNASRGKEIGVGGAVTTLSLLGTYWNELVFTSGYDVSQVRLNLTFGNAAGMGGASLSPSEIGASPDGAFSFEGAASVPEPSSILGASLALGLAALARLRRRPV